jgi:transcriptional regulator with XRE-family HTH domain
MSNKSATDVDKKIGVAVMELRMSQGLTRANVSDQLGIAQQQLLKYEKGINRFSISRLLEVCKILNVSIDEIAKFTPVKSDRNRLMLEHMRMYSKLDKKRQTSFNVMLKAF